MSALASLFGGQVEQRLESRMPRQPAGTVHEPCSDPVTSTATGSDVRDHAVRSPA